MQNHINLFEQGAPLKLKKAAGIAEIITQDAEAFAEVFKGALHHPKRTTRLRLAYALELASRKNARLLLPYQTELLRQLPKIEQPEVIWHVALLLGYLPLEEDDLALAVNSLFGWLDTVPHKFAKVNCLQSLTILAQKHAWLQTEVIQTLQAALEHESPAIRARARILLKLFKPAKR